MTSTFVYIFQEFCIKFLQFAFERSVSKTGIVKQWGPRNGSGIICMGTNLVSYQLVVFMFESDKRKIIFQPKGKTSRLVVCDKMCTQFCQSWTLTSIYKELK